MSHLSHLLLQLSIGLESHEVEAIALKSQECLMTIFLQNNNTTTHIYHISNHNKGSSSNMVVFLIIKKARSMKKHCFCVNQTNNRSTYGG